MKAGSFDLETCKEILGDAKVRQLEANARHAAETNQSLPLDYGLEATTWWDRCLSHMSQIVWQAAYEKRIARIERMKKQKEG